MSESLYDRLGGKVSIDTLIDRVVDLHLQNDTISTRYRSLDEATIARSREKAKEFFAAGAGGPVEYTGRSMLETHVPRETKQAEEPHRAHHEEHRRHHLLDVSVR